MEEYAIGIDLGTTNTRVAVLKNNNSNPNVKIIISEMGCRVTPSWVAFTDSEHLVGEAAKAQASVNPENTIYEAKRIIGRKMNEPEVQSMIKNWPFSVVTDVSNGNPSYEVTFMNDRKVVTPEQISEMVLTEVKRSADEYLGCPVKQAVITVPAYFNDSQRQATIDAGLFAGLEVLEIINEPTAAAIAYGFNRRGEHEINVLVFDMGESVLDIAIIAITDNDFEVKSVSENKDLGGRDIDNLLVEHFVNKFRVAHRVDLMNNLSYISRLRTQCEIAKCHLSSSLKQKIHVGSIHENFQLDEWLSRVKMDDILSDFFDSVIDHIEAALNDAGMTKDQIDEVILIGGSTRIPAIQSRVEEFFDGKKLNKTVNPEEAVVIGAAIWASRLGSTGLKEVTPSDVIPIPREISVRNTDMSVINAENTKNPTTNTRKYYTNNDNQSRVINKVFTGKSEKCFDNERLAEFTLTNVEKTKSIDVDRKGIMTFSTEDQAQKECKGSIMIDSYKGTVLDDIDGVILDEQNLNLNKEQIKADLRAKNELKNFACKLNMSCIEKYQKKNLSFDMFKKIDLACLDALIWLNENSDSSASESDKRLSKLREYCLDILIF